MPVGRVATISSLVLVSLSGCVEDEAMDPAPQCIPDQGTVHSVVVLDDQDPRNDIVRLDVVLAGGGLSDAGVAVSPWPGEAVFRFPYRLAPIIAIQDGATVTVTARNAAFEPVSTGTVALAQGLPDGCGVHLGFAKVEID